MHRSTGDNGTAAEVLQAENSIGPPDLLHAMPHEHNAGELSEGLNDVEVAQRADFKEGHAVLLCVGSGLLRWDLPLEGEVQPVSNQDPGNTRCMLINLLDPPVNAIKGPTVGDVVHQKDSLRTPRVGPEDGTEPSLARSIP